MLSRRKFVSMAAAGAALACTRASLAAPATLGHKERVDRALLGQEVDRPPFSLWHHFNKPTPEEEAQSLVEFHQRYDTDIVKAMNDFDYPRSTTGKWYEITPTDSPYPKQLETLELVRNGLNGDVYFIDTLFGPYFTAQLLLGAESEYADRKLSENQVLTETSVGIRAFQKRSPQAWHDMMGAITESTIKPVINYSVKTSGIPMTTMRANFTQTLAGGVDEIDYNSLTVAEIRRQWTTARKQAGPKYIITPGCALPKTSTPQALARLRQSLSA